MFQFVANKSEFESGIGMRDGVMTNVAEASTTRARPLTPVRIPTKFMNIYNCLNRLGYHNGPNQVGRNGTGKAEIPIGPGVFSWPQNRNKGLQAWFLRSN